MIKELLAHFTKAKRSTSIWMTDTTAALWPQSMTEYRDLSEEGYKQCAEVYACINLLAHTAKGVKWLVYQKPNNGKKLIEIEDLQHPLVKLLTRANQTQSWAKLIENIVGYYKVSGNCFLWRNGPSTTKPPSELWTLRPDRLTVLPAKTMTIGPVAGFLYKVEGKEPVPLMPDRSIDGDPWQQILHIKTFNPMDDLYGLSPIRAASRTVDQINEAAKLNYSLLKNGMRVSGAFISKGTFDEKLEAELKRQLVDSYAGAQNAGKQLLLTGELDWKEMGIRPKDMDWIEGQKMDTRRICSIFGVAPELIGDVQNKTYNNQKEARRALYIEAVMPLLDELEDAFNQWLTPMFGEDLILKYNRDDIEAIKDERNAIWINVVSAVDAGILTPNEGRDALGYEASTEAIANKLREQQAPKQIAAPAAAKNEPVTVSPYLRPKLN